MAEIIKNMQNNRIEEMFKAGVHFGYSKTRRHPSAIKYVFTTKNNIDIIDIEKTDSLLTEAEEYVKELAQSGKNIILVGTKAEAKQPILETALGLELPYVTERWVGGILTNFPEIKKRINRLIDLRSKKEKGELDKYTKKERLLIDREVEDMEKNFSGLVGMPKLPDVMFVIDPKKEHIAVTEAQKMKIPVIAVLNTDCNIKIIDYPIMANDGSRSSITFLVEKFKKAYEDGLMGQKTEEKETEAAK